MPWKRATPSSPCVICGKPDYCTYFPEAGIVKCMRVADGSYSTKTDACGVGHFHKHQFLDPPTPKATLFDSVDKKLRGPFWKSRLIDWSQIVQKSLENAGKTPSRMDRLANSLGVKTTDLSAFGIGWLTREDLQALDTSSRYVGAYTFPMKDSEGIVTGIRLRGIKGNKYAVKFSRGGLFYADLRKNQHLLIVDGASDALCGFSLGLNIVGRHSCTGGNGDLLKLIEHLQPTFVGQLLDNDDKIPAIKKNAWNQAKRLLEESGRKGVLMYPDRTKAKDLRDWVMLEGKTPWRLKRYGME